MSQSPFADANRTVANRTVARNPVAGEPVAFGGGAVLRGLVRDCCAPRTHVGSSVQRERTKYGRPTYWVDGRAALRSVDNSVQESHPDSFDTVKPPPTNVILYTRDGCHLCRDAEMLLRRHGVEPQLVDIESDSQLREKFDCCVPVVEIDGKIRFRGRVNEVLLRRLMRRRSDRDVRG